MNFITKIGSYLFPITLRHYKSTLSGNLYIVAENGRKVLNTDRVNYSFSSLHRIFKEAFAKTGVVIPHHAKVLMLGLGAGSIVDIIRNDYRSLAPITAVELDPVIIEVAKKEFGIDKSPAIHIVEADALLYVNNLRSTFDVICVDLFVQDQVPKAFLDHEFINQLISALEPGGKLYFNFMDCSTELSGLFNQRIEELKSNEKTFSSVIQLNLEENNRVLVVTK